MKSLLITLNTFHTFFYHFHCCFWAGKYLLCRLDDFNPIQNEGDAAPPHPLTPFHPTSLLPVTSTNVGISPKIFLTFSLTLFSYWCNIWRPHLMQVPNNCTWTKCTPQKIVFTGQVFIKLLFCYDKFSNRNARVTKLWWSQDHIYNIN